MGLDGASAPSKFLSAPSNYIYLTSTTRLLLRRSMNIKLSNYLIPQLRIDYDGKLVIIDRLWEGSPLL